MRRRHFLSLAGAAAAHHAIASKLPTHIPGTASSPRHADIRLRIEACLIEIGKGINLKTVAYNGKVPGPTLRLTEGKPVSIEVTNATNSAELVHWHGLAIDSHNDGAMEEGSPMIEPGKSLRYNFTPRPSGTRWYHTHAVAGADLTLGTYSGQFGFLLIDGHDSGHYDQEVNLAVRHWEPSFAPMVQTWCIDTQRSTNTCSGKASPSE